MSERTLSNQMKNSKRKLLSKICSYQSEYNGYSISKLANQKINVIFIIHLKYSYNLLIYRINHLYLLAKLVQNDLIIFLRKYRFLL